MEIGILGLASSGKSTLFRLLTDRQAEAAPGRRDQASLGMARVPDPRLDTLRELFSPKKFTPATVRYADVPGIPAEHGLENALNLPELRTMDALMVVLRGFADEAVPHPMGSVDPLRDLVHLEEEFVLQDQIVIERRLDRLERDLARRRAPELLAEQELLRHCLEALEAGTPLRSLDLDPAQDRILRGFTFLSVKPLLVVLNRDEQDLGEQPFDTDAWQSWMTRKNTATTAVCATLESELGELDEAEAAEFMSDLGISEKALDRIIHRSYELLGLISFFTVGEDECRAWSIRAGSTALDAAGTIHSDLARGFIRAEVVPFGELVDAGSLAACRQRGTLRLEGKSYAVRDGEIVHIRFNV